MQNRHHANVANLRFWGALIDQKSKELGDFMGNKVYMLLGDKVPPEVDIRFLSESEDFENNGMGQGGVNRGCKMHSWHPGYWMDDDEVF